MKRIRLVLASLKTVLPKPTVPCCPWCGEYSPHVPGDCMPLRRKT